MLSQKCKYALRCVLYLSLESSENKKIGSAEIAEHLKIPAAFTSKILQQLVSNSIVSSTKGPNGGFYLSKENKKKKLIDIVECIDGLDFFHQCGLGLDKCSDKKPCPLHEDFVKIRKIFHHSISTTNIDHLSKKILEDNLSLIR
ncbi:MAG: Rrf2 family transcriptional regulator [Bacteroidia bacterium]